MHIVRSLSPTTISINFSSPSKVPVAAVCLNDTFTALEDATYALRESYYNEIWYTQRSSELSRFAANHFIRFYCDDVALRLYAAAEHLANAIVAMLPVSERTLSRHQRKRSGLAATVGQYLIRQRSKHPLAQPISKLVNSPDWSKTIRYRDAWVHQQPPLIGGLGIQWERRIRWEEIKVDGVVTGHKLSGGDDKPMYEPEELRAFVSASLFTFVELFQEVLHFYLDLLSKNGITVSDKGLIAKA